MHRFCAKNVLYINALWFYSIDEGQVNVMVIYSLNIQFTYPSGLDPILYALP